MKLNVPVTDLDITISSPEGQIAPYVLSPARVDLSTIDHDNGPPEQDDLEHEEIDFSTTSITDIFSDPEDRNTSNSHHSSNSFTIESQPENATMLIDLETDEILLPNLILRLVSQAEKTDNINTWIIDTQDTTPPPFSLQAMISFHATKPWQIQMSAASQVSHTTPKTQGLG